MKALKNIFKSVFTPDVDRMVLPRSPIIVGMILLYLATLIGQWSDKINLHAIIGITIVLIIQLLLCLFSSTIFKNRYWLYFVVQGIITFDYAIIMPKGYEPLFIGLIPLFVFQSMIIYSDAYKVIFTAVCFYAVYCITIAMLSGGSELMKSIPVLIIITIAMRSYSIIFFNQIKLRMQTQKILKELELAYEKVEELTLTNERQRMARDLHDTLSQGLAGIIMQLEAVSANLKNNNTGRAQEIVKMSMEQARKTLSDSRLVINDLRSQSGENVDFKKSLENEIATFKNVSNASVTMDIRIISKIPLNIIKHTLYVVREALNNIAKHAKAKNAAIKIIESNNEIKIDITDDGIGFDIKLLDKLFGHYGIIGMTERVKAINGEIKIESKRKSGTNINIVIPIGKGIDDLNE